MIDTKCRPRLDGDDAVMTVMTVLVGGGGDDVDYDLDDARRDDDDDGDDFPLWEGISPAESARQRPLFSLSSSPPRGGSGKILQTSPEQF